VILNMKFMTIQHYQTTHKGETKNLTWTFICAVSSTKAANTITPPGQSDLSKVFEHVEMLRYWQGTCNLRN